MRFNTNNKATQAHMHGIDTVRLTQKDGWIKMISCWKDGQMEGIRIPFMAHVLGMNHFLFTNFAHFCKLVSAKTLESMQPWSGQDRDVKYNRSKKISAHKWVIMLYKCALLIANKVCMYIYMYIIIYLHVQITWRIIRRDAVMKMSKIKNWKTTSKHSTVFQSSMFYS